MLKDLEISAGPVKVAIPGEMKIGDYAEYWGEGLDSGLRPERCSASNCGSQSRAHAEGGRKQVGREGLWPRECEADSDYLRQVIHVTDECLIRQDRLPIT